MRSNTLILCEEITKLLNKYKAENIIKINLMEKSDIADYMIVCSGTSKRHVISLANYLLENLKKYNLSLLNVEGKRSGDWVLVDAGDIVTHLFRPEVRSFYNLESMWASSLKNNKDLV